MFYLFVSIFFFGYSSAFVVRRSSFAALLVALLFVLCVVYCIVGFCECDVLFLCVLNVVVCV